MKIGQPGIIENKLPGIEILRFIAALSVLIWHYQHFAFDNTAAFNKEHQPFYGAISFFYNHGSIGVEVFWCISGFIFFIKYRNSIYDRLISVKQFFVYRFSRLYPLHFVTLILVLILQIIYWKTKGHYFIYDNNDFKHFIQHLFLASNWFTIESSFNGPVWSVSVEILVYFLFFALIRLIGKSPVINIFIITGSVIIAWVLHVDSPINNCIYYFYAGGLIAIILQEAEKLRYLKTVLLVTAFLLIAIIFLIKTFTAYQSHILNILSSPFVLIPVVIFIAAQNVRLSVNGQKLAEVLGNMTYSSYLLHFPLQLIIVLGCYYCNTGVPYYSTTFFLFFILLVLLLSVIVFRFFEKPFQSAIRRRLLHGKE